MKTHKEELKRERGRECVELNRECVELIWFPEDAHGDKLENSVVQAFEIAGVNVEIRDFHVIG